MNHPRFCWALARSGVPLFVLELGMGQLTRRGTLGMWTKIGLPRWQGVGGRPAASGTLRSVAPWIRMRRSRMRMMRMIHHDQQWVSLFSSGWPMLHTWYIMMTVASRGQQRFITTNNASGKGWYDNGKYAWWISTNGGQSWLLLANELWYLFTMGPQQLTTHQGHLDVPTVVIQWILVGTQWFASRSAPHKSHLSKTGGVHCGHY